MCVYVGGSSERGKKFMGNLVLKKISENMAYGNVPLASKREIKLNAHWLKVHWETERIRIIRGRKIIR